MLGMRFHPKTLFHHWIHQSVSAKIVYKVSHSISIALFDSCVLRCVGVRVCTYEGETAAGAFNHNNNNSFTMSCITITSRLCTTSMSHRVSYSYLTLNYQIYEIKKVSQEIDIGIQNRLLL